MLSGCGKTMLQGPKNWYGVTVWVNLNDGVWGKNPPKNSPALMHLFFFWVFRSPRGYNPDRDGELTQPRSEEELLHLRYEVGATVDPYTNQTRYDGFRLIRVYPQTKQHLKDLRFLETGTRIAFHSI